MIQVERASYRYPGDSHLAVDEVSLEVRAGEVVGIVGPNGSGKSTLGRLMKGLLIPTAGRVLVDGSSTEAHDLEVRRRVGLVFQNPTSQIVNAVVENEVAFGLENLGLPPREVRERVEQALAAVGLEARRSAESQHLSMADKQRVAVAAVMAMNPHYLILDEPTEWIEPTARWPLLDQVLDWGRAERMGVVLITHRMEEAQIVQRLYGMRDGRIEVVGTPSEVLRDAKVRELLSLEEPETVRLGRALQEAGLPVTPGEPVPRLAEALRFASSGDSEERPSSAAAR